MKTLLNHSVFNLCSESKLIWAQSRPSSAPEKVPSVRKANEQRDLATEIGLTEERINQMLKHLDARKSSSRIDRVKKRALDVKARLAKLKEKYEGRRTAEVMRTLDNLNSRFDWAVKGFRIPFLQDLLKNSAKDIYKGNAESLVTAFALLKSDAIPLKIPGTQLKIHRRGHNLILENGSGRFKQKIMFKLALVGGKWQIQSAKGESLPITRPKVRAGQNPLAGIDPIEMRKRGLMVPKRPAGKWLPNAKLFHYNPGSQGRAVLKYKARPILTKLQKRRLETQRRKREAAERSREKIRQKQNLVDNFNYLNKAGAPQLSEMTFKPIVDFLKTLKASKKPYIIEGVASHNNDPTSAYILVKRYKGKLYYRISVTDYTKGMGTKATKHFYFPPNPPSAAKFKSPKSFKKWETTFYNKTQGRVDKARAAKEAREKAIERARLANKRRAERIAAEKARLRAAEKARYTVEKNEWKKGMTKQIDTFLKRLRTKEDMIKFSKMLQDIHGISIQDAADATVRTRQRLRYLKANLDNLYKNPNKLRKSAERAFALMPINYTRAAIAKLMKKNEGTERIRVAETLEKRQLQKWAKQFSKDLESVRIAIASNEQLRKGFGKRRVGIIMKEFLRIHLEFREGNTSFANAVNLRNVMRKVFRILMKSRAYQNLKDVNLKKQFRKFALLSFPPAPAHKNQTVADKRLIATENRRVAANKRALSKFV